MARAFIDSGEPTFGPCAMKNLHVMQYSFTVTSRSTSGFSSISSPHAVSCVGRSQTANLQSPGQRSPGMLCGQRLAISSSQPRVSQQCNAISAPPFLQNKRHMPPNLLPPIFPDGMKPHARKPLKTAEGHHTVAFRKKNSAFTPKVSEHGFWRVRFGRRQGDAYFGTRAVA